MGEFGDKFRKEREKQHISLEEVANDTKISSRMLLAIEEEQFDRLPGGVFNKGFIRAYAKYIGLNEDQAVSDYLACLRQLQIESQDVWDPQARPAVPTNRQTSPDSEELPELQLPRAEHVGPREVYGLRRERVVPWRILFLATVVVILAGLLWRRHSHGAHSDANAAPPATSAAQPVAQASAVPAQSTAVFPAALRPASVSASRPSTVSAASSSRLVNQTLAKPAIPIEASTSYMERTALPAQPDEAVKSPANPEASTPAAPLTLVIRASENSWISVTADGRTVIHELLIAPAHTSIHASREISVKIGNAGGVSFVWNGQELPAQGAEGDVKTLIFDESGMRDVTPSPAPAQNP